MPRCGPSAKGKRLALSEVAAGAPPTQQARHGQAHGCHAGWRLLQGAAHVDGGVPATRAADEDLRGRGAGDWEAGQNSRQGPLLEVAQAPLRGAASVRWPEPAMPSSTCVPCIEPLDPGWACRRFQQKIDRVPAANPAATATQAKVSSPGLTSPHLPAACTPPHPLHTLAAAPWMCRPNDSRLAPHRQVTKGKLPGLTSSQSAPELGKQPAACSLQPAAASPCTVILGRGSTPTCAAVGS
jgi:hypothetical protein